MSGVALVPFGNVTVGAVPITAIPVIVLRLTMTRITFWGSDAVSTDSTWSSGATARASGSGAVFAIPRAHHCVHACATVFPSACSVETVPICGSEESK